MGKTTGVRRVQSYKGSILVTVPIGIARELGIKKGQYVEFEAADGMLVIRPVSCTPGRADVPSRRFGGRTGSPDGLRALVALHPRTAEEYLGPELTALILAGRS
ncbi:MAG: AbrB/MazE/SpoVT family DNA-binding domain-containing protein [Gammaproteobacteria bacterium]|nr:AbrB/MazE/SpoVT family DNA-binding domain-containing protein [Gammaproteobacteria bacterium]